MTARQLPHRHLSVRVPWHDTAWDGRVCEHPLDNSACLRLGRIAEERNDALEVSIAGTKWAALSPVDLPPCASERAGFMASSARPDPQGAPLRELERALQEVQTDDVRVAGLLR